MHADRSARVGGRRGRGRITQCRGVEERQTRLQNQLQNQLQTPLQMAFLLIELLPSTNYDYLHDLLRLEFPLRRNRHLKE